MTKQNLGYTIWTATFLVYLLPMLQWGSDLEWDTSDVKLLTIFPLLGMWAFAQMWLHYAIGSLKRRQPEGFDYKGWYRATGNVVITLILLHPAILMFETIREGLTPLDYVSPENTKFIFTGYFALACFVLYEFADKLQGRQFWKKNFGIVKALSVLAMLMIFNHSLQLGQNLEEGWLRYVWVAMFVTFVGFVVDSYIYKPKSN